MILMGAFFENLLLSISIVIQDRGILLIWIQDSRDISAVLKSKLKCNRYRQHYKHPFLNLLWQALVKLYWKINWIVLNCC